LFAIDYWRLFINQYNDFSVVTAIGNQEVLYGTDLVLLSCKVTGLTKTASVKWEKSDGAAVTDTTGYTVVEGQLASGTQTTTLTIGKAQTTADADYKCLITLAVPDDTTVITETVSLNVFSKFDNSVSLFTTFVC
jgi:hypothetical protein